MASTLITLGTIWIKLASAGRNVIVHNPGGLPIVLTTASGAPVGTAGIQLAGGEKQSGILAADLYARSDGGASVILADGFFSSFSPGTTSPETSSAGGGASNTADFTDQNNAYLAVLAA